MIIRKYVDRDLPEIIRIWNEVVEEGMGNTTNYTKHVMIPKEWEVKDFRRGT